MHSKCYILKKAKIASNLEWRGISHMILEVEWQELMLVS
jgi:hypothetical protein